MRAKKVTSLMRRALLLIFTLLMMLLMMTAAMLSLAQGGGHLEPNSITNGELTENNTSDVYTFDGTAEMYVTILLESTDFDAYLLLLDAAGNVLAEDDDSGGRLNALINVMLPVDGVYTVRATSQREYSSNGEFFATGMYTLTLEAVSFMQPSPTPTLTAQPNIFQQQQPEATQEPLQPEDTTITGDIAPGQPVQDNLTNRNLTMDYTFNASAGDTLTITLVSDDFDAYLYLLDAEGFEIAFDDDSAGNLNSRIGPFVIPVDGSYTVQVTSFGGDETGAFTLSMERATIEEVAYGALLTGVLDDFNTTDVYTLPVRAGDVFTLTLQTDNYSVFVRTTDSYNNYYPELYSSSSAVPIIVAEDDNFIITIGTYDTLVTSQYSVQIERLTPQAAIVDEPMPVNFDEAGVLLYTFEGQAGDVMNITAESGGSVDTQITVIDPSGFQLAFDDDGGPGYDPEILNMVLTENGTYSVIVSPFIPGDNGDFTVLIANSPLAQIDESSQTIRISVKQYQGVVTFAGTAGETVRVGARVLSMGLNSPFITITQDGNIIASNEIGNVERLLLEFTVPEDGQVQVRVEDFSYNAAVVELNLERVITSSSGASG